MNQRVSQNWHENRLALVEATIFFAIGTLALLNWNNPANILTGNRIAYAFDLAFSAGMGLTVLLGVIYIFIGPYEDKGTP